MSYFTLSYYFYSSFYSWPGFSLTVYTIYTVSEFIKSLLMQQGHTAVLTLHFKCSTGERFYGDAVRKRNVPLMSDASVAFLLCF